METSVRSVIQVVSATSRREGPAMVYRALPSKEIGFIDPFLALGEFHMSPSSQGFGFHPHHGVEFITYQLGGKLRHSDPAGTQITMETGEAIHLVAGKYMEHSEMPVGGDESHGMQLWIDLPLKDKQLTHTYRKADKDQIYEYRQDGTLVRVIVGEKGPLTLHVPALYLDVNMEAGAYFNYALPSEWNAFIQILSGDGTFGSSETIGQTHDLVLFDKGGNIIVTATSSLHFLLLAALPNNEGGKGMFG